MKKICLVVFAFLIQGCSTSIIVKDCEGAQASGKQICKTLKPWE